MAVPQLSCNPDVVVREGQHSIHPLGHLHRNSKLGTFNKFLGDAAGGGLGSTFWERLSYLLKFCYLILGVNLELMVCKTEGREGRLLPPYVVCSLNFKPSYLLNVRCRGGNAIEPLPYPHRRELILLNSSQSGLWIQSWVHSDSLHTAERTETPWGWVLWEGIHPY